MPPGVPDAVGQEVRNLVALQCRNALMEQKAQGAKEIQQEAFMQKAFHGSEAHASSLKLFLNGENPFEMAFDRIPIVNNRQGNEFRGATGGDMLELRDIFHCDPAACYCTQDEGLTFDVLSSCKGKKLTGRNIIDRSLKVVKHYTFLLKYFKEYADANKDNPSGLKLEHMIAYVRPKVYVSFRGSQNSDGGNKAREYLEEDMPSKHFPNGWFAFLLFGPMPVAGYALGCLGEDDNNVEKIGRAETRKQELVLKQREREAGIGGFQSSDYTGGTTISEKAKAAYLAQSELENEKKNVLGLLQQANSDHTATVAELREVRELIREHKSEQPDIEDQAAMDIFSKELCTLTQWRIRVISKLGNVSTRKDSLENIGCIADDRQTRSATRTCLTNTPRDAEPF